MAFITDKKVLCFGEALLRIQSSSPNIYEQSNCLKVYPGGSEANVAVSLAQMGISSQYYTCGPQNKIFIDYLKQIENLGVDSSKVTVTGERLGSYYLFSADGLTQGDVVYDRMHSSFANLSIKDIDYQAILDDVEWLHFTAITPAINPQLAEVCSQLLKNAVNKNITISVDLNYRSKLWQYGKLPIEVMPELIKHADVIMGNIWASNKMLGTSINEKLNRNSSIDEFQENANKMADEIWRQYPKCKHIANTFRFMDSPQHNLFYSTYHNRSSNFISTIHETNEVIDRIGSGDAYMAGLIRALIMNENPQQIIETATKSGFNKLFVEGDFGNGKF